MKSIENIASSRKRIILFAAAITGLSLVFVFQQTDFVFLITQSKDHPDFRFSVNRGIRLLLNDLFMLLLIAVWFREKSITKLALSIQLIDFFILLPIYLYFKLSLEGDSEISSPLLSQIHRLVVNPTLMILLIPAIYFQRMMKKQ